MILVTKPFLPPKESYYKLIDQVWSRNWLTNNGPLVNQLELKLKHYLNVKHILYVGNGTIALQIAIKALKLKGDIITTPFSYVATTSSIVWENCNPIFVDINSKTYNINSDLIEKAITKETTAILATHVFGNPCEIEEIEEIALKHNIKVIYDAAHCFGVTYKDKSIFEYGNISTTSFHATKLFHTIEGGAIITKDPDILKTMAYLRNFGHDGPNQFKSVGINGRNSEFHAAMGLCNLPYISEILERRKTQYLYYKQILSNYNLSFQQIKTETVYNYAYFPILFDSQEQLLIVKQALEQKSIFPRRYFHPSLSSLKYVNNYETPISNQISNCILCLPLSHTLSNEEMNMITRIIIRTLKYN